ncbi:MAG: hypothetical protein ACYC3O_02490 [Burkholderiales bacterium]
MKRTDLHKQKGLKITERMKQAGTPDRFAQEAAIPDRREQRKIDKSQGLVPFAVKLNIELVVRLQALARTRGISIHELTAELLKNALST